MGLIHTYNDLKQSMGVLSVIRKMKCYDRANDVITNIITVDLALFLGDTGFTHYI